MTRGKHKGKNDTEGTKATRRSSKLVETSRDRKRHEKSSSNEQRRDRDEAEPASRKCSPPSAAMDSGAASTGGDSASSLSTADDIAKVRDAWHDVAQLFARARDSKSGNAALFRALASSAADAADVVAACGSRGAATSSPNWWQDEVVRDPLGGPQQPTGRTNDRRDEQGRSGSRKHGGSAHIRSSRSGPSNLSDGSMSSSPPPVDRRAHTLAARSMPNPRMSVRTASLDRHLSRDMSRTRAASLYRPTMPERMTRDAEAVDSLFYSPSALIVPTSDGTPDSSAAGSTTSDVNDPTLVSSSSSASSATSSASSSVARPSSRSTPPKPPSNGRIRSNSGGNTYSIGGGTFLNVVRKSEVARRVWRGAEALSNDDVADDGEPDVGKLDLTDGSVSIHEVLGSGGIGSVFRASQHGKSVAVKVYSKAGLDSRQINEMRRHFHTVASLRHPRIVQLHATNTRLPDALYMTMEYLPTSARALVDMQQAEVRRRLPLAVVLPLLTDLALGLAFLHGRSPQLMHRDVKSENLFVEPVWESLNDPAPVMRAKLGDTDELTTVNDRLLPFVGTPEFMSPEMVRRTDDGLADYGTATDMWSFGCTIGEFLSTEQPYRYEKLTPFQLPDVIAAGTRPHIDVLAAHTETIPGEEFNISALKRMANSCTSADVAQRPTAQEAADRLGDANNKWKAGGANQEQILVLDIMRQASLLP